MSQSYTKRVMLRALFLLVAILTLVGCARRVHPIIGSPITAPYSQDVSLDELLSLYQKEQAALPPLIGLMEVSVSDSLLKRFWAKWRSHSDTMKIEGFDLLGGSLFDFQWKRQPTGQTETGQPETGLPEIIFTAADSGKEFVGSRKGFKRYLDTQTSEMRMEWLTLLDWVARGGLPDVGALNATSTTPYRPALEKQKDQLILYFFMEEEKNPVLMQKVFIDPESLRVTEALFFDPTTGAMEAQISFRDYRYVGRSVHSAGGALTNRVLFPFLITIKGAHFFGEVAFKELKIMERPE
jgi:hypothetical protein